MRKISVFLVFCMLFSLLSIHVGAAKPNAVTVTVNGETVAFDEQPFIEGGRVLVPLRKFMEALGAQVTWDAATQTVTAKKDQTTISLVINSKTARVNEKAVTLDVPARIQRGRTFVPLRFLSENLASVVSWDGTTRTVTVRDPQLYDLPLTAETSILVGRFQIKMPKGSTTHEGDIGSSIMSAMKASVQVTASTSLTCNGQTAHVYAQDMFAYSSGDLQTDGEIVFAKNLKEESKSSLEQYQTKSGIQTVLFRHAPTSSEKGELELLAKAKDDTLIYLNLSVTATDGKSKDELDRYLVSILDTMEHGDRMLNTAKRTETIQNYQIDVAEDYLLYCNSGIDFDVYYLEKLKKINEPAASMGIYIGGYPSHSEEKKGYSSSQIKKTQDTILGKSITWLYYGGSTVNSDSYVQTLIPLDDYFKMHIFISPSNETDMNEMKAMARFMRNDKSK